ncbi:MAG: hypothetical protein ACM3ZT_08420 [Bacillota bacterium]
MKIAPKSAVLAIVSLTFVIAVPALITPCFIEGDNNAIADFAAQGFPVPYAGVLFTGLLHWGYAAAPSFPWYGAALYACHGLALFLWLSLVWRACRPAWFAVAASLVLLIFYLRELVFLDYTSTSVMLCSSAAAWAFLDALEHRPGLRRPLLSGLVFMLGMLVRPQAATGALAFLLAATAWVSLLAFSGQPLKAEARRLGLIALVFFAPALCNLATDSAVRAITMTPQEAQYEAFNLPRGRFFRLPRLAKFRLANNKPVLDSLHWERSDLLRVLSWTMLDERKYTPEAMQTLLAAATPRGVSWKDWREALRERLWPPDPYLLLLLCPLPLLLLAAWRRPSPEILGLLAAPWAVGLACYMSLHYAFLYRVEFPYLGAVAFTELVLAASLARAREKPARLDWVAAGLCVVIALSATARVAGDEAEDGGVKALHAALFTDKLRILQQGYAGSVILAKSGNGLPFKDLSPLASPVLYFRPIQLGWSTFSPRFYQQIGALGVEHAYQVADALVDRPGAYLLGPRDWSTEVMGYLSGKRGVTAVTVKCFPDGTRLMRLETQKP